MKKILKLVLSPLTIVLVVSALITNDYDKNFEM
jgi:hypothetical protein